jgi:two-component system LytT family sensor kinase
MSFMRSTRWFSMRSTVAISVAWTVVAFLAAAHAGLADAYLGRGVNWPHEFLWSALDWYTCAIFTPAFIVLVRYAPFDRRRLVRSAFIYVSVICVTVVAKYAVYVPLRSLFFPSTFSLRDTLVVDFYSEFLAFAFIVVIAHAVQFYQVVQAQQLEKAQLETELAEAQLETLRTQLQPHFLFNTLNAISALMHSNVRAADDMLAGLAQLLRFSLDRGASQRVALRDELATVTQYVAIMKVRFGERLDVRQMIAPATLDEYVPQFVLQPIIENAIRHGMDEATSTCIGIEADFEDESLVIRISDNGTGFANEMNGRSGTGIGLRNTRERLARLYGAAANFSIGPGANGGTIVRIVIPRATAIA